MVIDKLVIGTVQFGLEYGISNSIGKTNKAEAHAILDYCYQTGIKFIDTARAYGNAEEIIGKFRPIGFSIISKFFIDVEFATLQKNLEYSLQKLNTSKLYAYMAHDADQLSRFPLLWDELQKVKAEGTIQKIGFSLYQPEQLKRLLDKGILPDIVQVPYNILDIRFEAFFPDLKKIGCEIHTRSAFLQGLFFMDYHLLSNHFEPVKHFLKKLQLLFKDLEERAAYLLQFCLLNNYIDKVVFGVNSLSQLKNNLMKLSKTKPYDNKDFLHNNINIPDSILLPNNWPINYKK